MDIAASAITFIDVLIRGGKFIAEKVDTYRKIDPTLNECVHSVRSLISTQDEFHVVQAYSLYTVIGNLDWISRTAVCSIVTLSILKVSRGIVLCHPHLRTALKLP